MPDNITCPDPACTAPATIVDRWTWPSTHGPVEHIKTHCTRGHWFTPARDTIAARPAPELVVAATANPEP